MSIFVLGDFVKETSTTSGNGTLDLDGALAGFETFVARIGDDNKTFYALHDSVAQSREVGIGKVTAAVPNKLSRDIIISSTNANNPLNLAGNKIEVFCTAPSIPFIPRYKTIGNANYVVSELDNFATLHNGEALAPRDIVINTNVCIGTRLIIMVEAAQLLRLIAGAGASLKEGTFAARVAGQGLASAGIGSNLELQKGSDTEWRILGNPHGTWVPF